MFKFSISASLTHRCRRRAQRAHGAEEALVQQLEQLQRALVHRRARAARAHQRHVDDRRVVVARVLPAQEKYS